MERSGSLRELLAQWRKKLSGCQYALLVALLGVALMLLPGTRHSESESQPAAQTQESAEAALCRQLEAILSQVDGAGTVSCLLTYSEGSRTVYQTDTVQSGGGEVRVSTVLVSTGSGTEQAVAVGATGPVYQGVVVVCDGADSARLRLEMIRAVSALTGLSSDKIAVVKRKETS